MNLRRKAAETLENVTDASTTVRDAMSLHTILLCIVGLGVCVAINLGVNALAASRK